MSSIKNTSEKRLVKAYDNGEVVLKNEDRILVEKQADGSWRKVTPGDRFVSMDELGKNFGLWKDQEVSRGLIFSETVRPLNGAIEADEVVEMGAVLNDTRLVPVDGRFTYDRLRPENAELKLDADGGELRTDWEKVERVTIRTPLYGEGLEWYLL
jgi:hypothetical protein